MDIFGIGLPELLLILVLALIVFGPERLPKIARDLGSTLGNFRREAEGIRQEFIASMETVQGPVKDSLDEIRATLASMPVKNLNFPPVSRPAPIMADDQETATLSSSQPNTPAAPTPTSSMAIAAAAAPSAKSTPSIAAPVAADAPINVKSSNGVAKHKQDILTKPQPRPAEAELALPAPMTITPPLALPEASTPLQPTASAIATIGPGSTPAPTNTAPIGFDETPAFSANEDGSMFDDGGLFAPGSFFAGPTVGSAGEAAILPDDATTGISAARDGEVSVSI